MAKLKTNEIESYLKRPHPAHRVLLIYGPDHGLVVERGKLIAKQTGIPLDDPFQTIQLDLAAIEDHTGRLVDEANTLSMFGGQRLIWLRNIGAERSVADAVNLALKSPNEDALIIVEAGDLKPSAALRKTVEQSEIAVAIPCYADDARSLQTLIDQVTSEFNLTLDMDARQQLLSQLGSDRLASRGEIEKICLYALGDDDPSAGRITLDDIQAISGDVSDKPISTAIDAVLAGNLNDLEISLTRLFSGKTPAFLLISALMREFRNLAALRATMDHGKDARAAVDSARPPIFFKRKGLITEALRLWNSDRIGHSLGRIETAILETRQRHAPEEAITRTLFLALAVETARHKRQR